MENKYVNSFEYVDNFAKDEGVHSIPIFEANLSQHPKVTIAIPTYKRAALLKEAVDSALNQIGFDEYDVIVVDNDPDRDDETEKLMLNYNNPKLSYYKNMKNIGMIGNWNRLYTLARGEWVVMLHDDDLLYNDYLSILFNKYIDVHCKIDAFFPKAISNEKKHVQRKRISSWYLTVNDFLRDNIVEAPLGFCIKKKSVIDLGGFSTVYHPSSDYEFYVRMLANNYKALRLEGHSFCFYRISVNYSLNPEVVLEFLRCDDLIRQNILNNKSLILCKLWHYYNKSHRVRALKDACLKITDNAMLLNRLEIAKKEEKISSKIVFVIIESYKRLEIKVRAFKYLLYDSCSLLCRY